MNLVTVLLLIATTLVIFNVMTNLQGHQGNRSITRMSPYEWFCWLCTWVFSIALAYWFVVRLFMPLIK